jgi:MerR family transcriptional regulator, copper efflux regulator
MAMDHMNIGDAANASGVSAKLIRYYESIDLIPEAGRTESGYRVYTEAEVQTLRFIKRARSLGFPIKQIGQLLALWHDRSRTSAQVRSVALAHIEELETKILELRSMANTLRKLAASCHNDKRPDCPILDDLADAELPRRLERSKKIAGQRYFAGRAP